MPQYRKLHGRTVESLDFDSLPDDFARLMWVLLPTQLCREGRGVDNANWLRSRVFPLRDDVTPGMIDAAMLAFSQAGMIDRYRVKGRPYFVVCNWHKYQGNTEKEADSIYPSPEERDPPPDTDSKKRSRVGRE